MRRLADRINTLKEATGASATCGWMFDEVAIMLYALVKMFRPGLVIQTGHLWGKSACVVLEALTDGQRLEEQIQAADTAFAGFVTRRTSPIPADAKLISVDPNPSGVNDWQAGVVMLKSWYGANFEFVQKASWDWFADTQADFADGRRLMGIVDGDHSERVCADDIANLARVGAGLILIDDTEWIGALEFVSRRMAETCGYDMINLPWINGLALMVRKGSTC